MNEETRASPWGHPTVWIEIDVLSLRHNFRAIHNHLFPAEKQATLQEAHPADPRIATSSIMPIVKANAYGHGLLGCAAIFEEEGAQRFGVALLEEAHKILAFKKTRPQESKILVLTPPLPEQADDFCRQRIEFVAADLATVEAFSAAARRHNQTLYAHLWIDTGMAREGISPHEAVSFAKKCQKFTNIQLVGLCTHFATSEDPEEGFAHTQLLLFDQARWELQKAGFSFSIVHAANSGALLRFPASHFSLVRPGLLLYGHIPHKSLSNHIGVRPALSLHTRIVAIRQIQAEQSVGYGQGYKTSKATTIVTLPIGYADGLERFYPRGLFCLIRGKRHPIVGLVCMNHCMVDVGEDTVALGDEVVLIGRQGAHAITADELAHSSNTIVYKTLASLSEKIPRIFVEPTQSLPTKE